MGNQTSQWAGDSTVDRTRSIHTSALILAAAPNHTAPPSGRVPMDRPRVLIACFLAFSVIALVGVTMTNEFSWRSPGESVLAEQVQSPDDDMMSRLEDEAATLQDVLQAQQVEKNVISQSESQPAAEDDTHSQTTSDQPDPDTVQTLSTTAETTQSGASEGLERPNSFGVVDGPVDSDQVVDQGDVVPEQTPDQRDGVTATEQQPVEQPANGAASTVDTLTAASNDSGAEKQAVPADSNDAQAEKQA